MIYFYFLLWLAIAATTLVARTRRVVHILCGCYLTVHAVFIEQLLFGGEYLSTSGLFFTFDEAGTLFYILLAIVALFVFRHSEEYLKADAIEHYRLYFSLMMLLTTAITGVYFANNIAITWILLEATTLCGAGILYYRRSKPTLEATWKYLFVCSTGIAIPWHIVTLCCSRKLFTQLCRLARTHCARQPSIFEGSIHFDSYGL